MRALALPLLLMLTLGLAGCGGSTSTPASSSPQTPPSTLTGNWLLSGSRARAAYPVISTSLHVDGSVVTGEASVASQCTSGMFSGTSTGTLSIKGTIANDGTFQASGALVGPTGGTFSLSISGSSPASTAPSVWTGNYSFVKTDPPNGSCSTSQSATFTAASIAPVTGTYIGVPANPGTLSEPFGANATLTVQITQGAPTSVKQGSSTAFPIPLTAELIITNSPCAFSASTTASGAPAYLEGDRFSLPFLTLGAPGRGFLDGTLDDSTANNFSGDLTILANGLGCQGIAVYEFTRK